jgi:hypothetical protein
LGWQLQFHEVFTLAATVLSRRSGSINRVLRQTFKVIRAGEENTRLIRAG